MSPKAKGRLCAKCDKVVVDFTHKSDLEIKQHFYENDNVCGRFQELQLNRPLTQNSSAWKFGALAFSYLFLNNYVSGQHVLPGQSDTSITLANPNPANFLPHPGLSNYQMASHQKGKSNVIEIHANLSFLKNYGVSRLIVETGKFQIPLDSR